MQRLSFRNHQEEIDHAKNALNAERKGVAPMSRKFTDSELKAGRETMAIRATPRAPVYVPPPVTQTKINEAKETARGDAIMVVQVTQLTNLHDWYMNGAVTGFEYVELVQVVVRQWAEQSVKQ